MGKKGAKSSKIPCELCGEMIAKNWMKRHLEEHKAKPLKFEPVRAVPKITKKKMTKLEALQEEEYVGKEFSDKARKEIIERDGGLCVKCKSPEVTAIHHIIYKSQRGRGHIHNGACVCMVCHDWAHLKCVGPFGEPREEGRKWFEEWRKTHLFPLYGLKNDPYLVI